MTPTAPATTAPATPATAASATTTRMTKLASLLTKAAERGVPIPETLQVHTHLTLGGVTFLATPHEYAAWCELLDASDVDSYIRDGIRWQTASAQHQGLIIEWYSGSPITTEGL